MRTRVLLFTVTAGLALVLFQGMPLAHAQSPAAAALTGRVTSQEEGAMEGVVVSAKKDGSTITVSVVSDKQGVYSFPANRLEPGHYSLKIRAVGYDLDGVGTADVLEHKAATADLKLRKTKNIVASAYQCGMDVERSRNRGAEGLSAELCGLPHAGTRREVDPRCERIHPGHLANERLRTGKPADQAPAYEWIRTGRESPNSTASKPNIWPPSI